MTLSGPVPAVHVVSVWRFHCSALATTPFGGWCLRITLFDILSLAKSVETMATIGHIY